MIQHQINENNLKPGLVASYDIEPGNRAGLVSNEEINPNILAVT